VSEETPEHPVDETVEVRPTEETAEIPAPAAHTVEIPSPVPSRLHPSVALLFLAIAAASLLAGIGVGALTRPAREGVVVARARVGEGGAIIAFDAKGQLRIPAGALRDPVSIEIRRTVVNERLRINPPAGPLYVFEPRQLIAYTFEPRNVRFIRPVRIVLPLEKAERNGTAFSYVNGTVLFLGGRTNAERGTIAVEVFDFAFRAGRAPEAE
jgi:hypothetical protein